MNDAQGIVDLHTHILPGVDDGARDMNESLSIIREAASAAVSGIVLTPHVSLDGKPGDLLDVIESSFDDLKKAVAQSGIDVDLYLGAELMLHPGLPEFVKNEARVTVNGKGRHVMVEMPFFEMPIYAFEVLLSLILQGVTPIWVHPERCVAVMKDYRLVRDAVNNGVLIQLNAGSLIGMYGGTVKKTMIGLLKLGIGTVVASDTHSVKGMENWKEAAHRLRKVVGEARANELLVLNPAALVNRAQGPGS